MPDTQRVAIIGGGPCGLLTGLLLVRAGVPVTIFERNAGISTHPKAMGVSRRTAEIYRQLGLLERIREGSLSSHDRWLAIWSKSLVGEELGRTPITQSVSAFTPCIPLHCPQTWAEQVILEALQQEPACNLCFGSNVTALSSGEDGVELTISRGGTEETQRFPWVVAADGAGSQTRRWIGIEAEGPGDMGHFINTMFRADYGRRLGDRKAMLYQALSSEYFEFFVAINGADLWLMHHFLQPGEKAEDFPAARLAEIIKAASGLPDEPVEVLSISPWVMSPKVAASLRKGRVFLVGDAAARLSPAGGLGLNTGMQSAHNLAWKLAAVWHDRAGETLLDSYEAERLPISCATMRNTNSNAQDLMAIVESAMSGDWDKARHLIAHSRRAGSGLGQDFGHRYESSAVLPDAAGRPPLPPDPLNTYEPSGASGGRAPHLWLTRAGERISSLDLFGKEFVLMAGSRGADWSRATEVTVVQVGRDVLDSAGEFERLYGLTPAGAVLIRPDGYIAARWPEHEEGALPHALEVILGRY